MDIWKLLYISVTSLILFLALATASTWACSGGLFDSGISYLAGVPFVYLFTPAIGLLWFSEQHLDYDRKRHRLVWIGLGLTFLFWLYVTIIFFFGTTIEIYQNGSH
ncbi:MAG: hypothetical protein V3V05_00820 [Pontiella sp.]